MRSPWNCLEKQKNLPPTGTISSNRPPDLLQSSCLPHLVYPNSRPLNLRKTVIENISGKNELPLAVEVPGL